MTRLIIGIASCGRAEILSKTLADIGRQSLMPDIIYVSPINPDKDTDFSNLPEDILNITEMVCGPAGLAFQRNTIIHKLEDDDIILFLDDDFVMHEDYCKQLMAIFMSDDSIGGHAGNVWKDGVNIGGIEFEDAKRDLCSDDVPQEFGTVDNGTTYGCNMAFRASLLKKHDILLDENLPLYAWFEDLDFSARVAKVSRVVNSRQCVGIHLGVKSGRTSGVKLGYSQVVNPFYMVRKGTMARGDAINKVTRRVVANVVRSFRPEPWVDRKGRLKGNWLGLVDILRGKARHDRILEL
jgi:GT2 family glycosyltransferase